jgi:hypothetical protein
MKKTLLTSVIFLLASLTASATLIGYESFATDGLIADQTAGTGFEWDRFAGGVISGNVSDWDNEGGTPSVVGGKLVTLATSASREYNGTSEGSTSGDGPTTERAGGFRGVDAVYYSVEMTRSAGADWGGISSFDFAAERIFFGIPGGQVGTKFFGIDDKGGASVLSTTPAVDGQTYTLVTKLDFDNDLLSLWLDPSVNGEMANSPIITLGYTGGNWSTAARLGSGGTGQTDWDELRIGDTWADVVINTIPEPSALGLIAFGAGLFMIRRR